MPDTSDTRNTPDRLALEHVRTLLASGHAHQALETAVGAAVQRGLRALDTAGTSGTPTERFLLALQAVAGELEGIGATLAAGEGQAEVKG